MQVSMFFMTKQTVSIHLGWDFIGESVVAFQGEGLLDF